MFYETIIINRKIFLLNLNYLSSINFCRLAIEPPIYYICVPIIQILHIFLKFTIFLDFSVEGGLNPKSPRILACVTTTAVVKPNEDKSFMKK